MFKMIFFFEGEGIYLIRVYLVKVFFCFVQKSYEVQMIGWNDFKSCFVISN